MPLPEGDRGGGLRLDGDHRGGDVILATPLLAVNIIIIIIQHCIVILATPLLAVNIMIITRPTVLQSQALLSKLDSIEVRI